MASASGRSHTIPICDHVGPGGRKCGDLVYGGDRRNTRCGPHWGAETHVECENHGTCRGYRAGTGGCAECDHAASAVGRGVTEAAYWAQRWGDQPRCRDADG